MNLKRISSVLCFLVFNTLFAQIPHDFNVSSNSSAERIARFKVQDDAFDFLEITNGSQNSGMFHPKIWAHQQSDNRRVLNFTASTNSNRDNGNTPVMLFRSEIRNSLNLNAPTGGTFPWGTQLGNVLNRPLFGWYNGSNLRMILNANGNFGIGISNPTSRLHTNGTVRFQNLPNASTATFMLGTDANGNVREYPVPNEGDGNNDTDWLKTNGDISTSINDNIYTNGRVGISTVSPTANLHTNGTIRFENLPNGRTPFFILGTDSSGNVKEYPGNASGLVLQCLLPGLQSSTNRLTKVSENGNLTCSQVFDNGTNVGIGTTFPTYKLSVNGPVHSIANIFISDKKFKKNISSIKNPLETVLRLNGKKYDWKIEEFDNYDFTKRKQIGFIAQEVKEIIPEVVYVDKESGEHSMNYTALIPILVEAIKEQQSQIIILENEIYDLKEIGNKEKQNLSEEKTYFSSNYPNPFNMSTKVDYYILKSIKNAKIVIYDSNGTIIKNFNLKERGIKSQLIINKDNLSSGIYFYTLITDNVVIGTKKMIVN